MTDSLKHKKIYDRLTKPYFILSVLIVLFVVSRISMYVVFMRATGDHSVRGFLVSMNKWDTGWYQWYVTYIGKDLEILHATPTYNGQAWWAFFPLFPSIVAFFWKIFGNNDQNNILLIGEAVNTVFFLVAEYFGFKYMMVTRKSLFAAYSYVAFMSLGLYSFYFSILYTEALFLMLLTLCFYFLKTKRYIAMGIAGAFLSATRNAGIMFVFVILVDLIEEYIRQEAKFDKKAPVKSLFSNLKDFVVTNLKKPELIFGTCLVPLGFFSFMALLSKITGDGLAFLHVQRAWGKNSNGLLRNLKYAFYNEFPPDFLSIATLLIIILIVITCINQKRFYETTFSVIILLASASSSFYSVPRYAIGCFTVVVAFSDEFSKFKPLTRAFLGVIIAAMEIILIKYWILVDPNLV
ncbi:MAG: hypothetical protein J5883_01295 [Clostridiales bacterium]|nr:hypothetical protein [Clostridiales bacterium]